MSWLWPLQNYLATNRSDDVFALPEAAQQLMGNNMFVHIEEQLIFDCGMGNL
jgi:hypothetical protein